MASSAQDGFCNTESRSVVLRLRNRVLRFESNYIRRLLSVKYFPVALGISQVDLGGPCAVN